MDRVYLTRDGYEKLAEELDFLKKTKRREITAAIEHARQLGDLKENAEYHAAKEAMSHNEARISDLEDKLSRVEIIDDVKIDADKVFIGAKVKVLDMDTEIIDEYMLVGPEEVDPVNGLISTTSPVGKAFLGHKVGDIVQVDVPAGTLKYKITEISR
ncbi:MAG: transcription elongation factor GreA [Candidatus Omnitrophica bacterium]|nr:transcription elongation factor GreA [Candidatus Omnitrophota bacterium]MDD5081573.1 transcription elongation factor GreA [Candidatus Omnitrophota bacterium]MDD5441305.1 transcription elongation factor GreA [Candidatus Omnitrophota bacterium]